MSNRAEDLSDVPALYPETPPVGCGSETRADADTRLSEQAWARPWQRRNARAAIEFNARLPLRARQEGIRAIRKAPADVPMSWCLHAPPTGIR